MTTEYLIQRLTNERFGGKRPELKPSTFAGRPVLLAEDNLNYYHLDGLIMKQGKRNDPAKRTDTSIRCYDCDTEIRFEAGKVDENNQPRFVFYCPHCNPEKKQKGYSISEID